MNHLSFKIISLRYFVIAVEMSPVEKKNRKNKEMSPVVESGWLT